MADNLSEFTARSSQDITHLMGSAYRPELYSADILNR